LREENTQGKYFEDNKNNFYNLSRVGSFVVKSATKDETLRVTKKVTQDE